MIIVIIKALSTLLEARARSLAFDSETSGATISKEGWKISNEALQACYL